MATREWQITYAKKINGTWKSLNQKVCLSFRREGPLACLLVHHQSRTLETVHLSFARPVIYSSNNKSIKCYQDTKEFVFEFTSKQEAIECENILVSFNPTNSQVTRAPQSSQDQTSQASQVSAPSQSAKLKEQGRKVSLVNNVIATSATEDQHVQQEDSDMQDLTEASLEERKKEVSTLIHTLMRDEKFKELYRLVELVVESEPNILNEL